MAHFQGQAPQGKRVQELELLVRTALFKSASALVGVLLQQAAERSDAAYQPKAGRTAQRPGNPPGAMPLWHLCSWRGIIITIPANTGGTIRRTPRWAWRWATRPPWPG